MVPREPRLFIQKYTITQIITDNNDPAGAASPIGNNVSGYHSENKYDAGKRTTAIDRILCINPIYDFPYAQKYPVKQKCIPANILSKI